MFVPIRLTRTVALLCLICATGQTLGQDGTDVADESRLAVEDAESTVVYEADFFAPYNPVSANDMLDRIPGLSLGGGRGGGRGLGTGGNLLINGQRIAGKDNSPRDQLDRISAQEVTRIEIIRDTSGELNVRGASQVVNIILDAEESRSSTSVEVVNRLNHDDTFELGGSVSHSRQFGNLQALVNAELRPNYENRDNREFRLGPGGDLIGTLFETNIRDQDELTLSSNLSYGFGAHRMQFNTQYGNGDYVRPIRRDFLDFDETGTVARLQEDVTDNVENSWEIGGDYEYDFTNGSRFLMLFVVNEEVRDSVRERFSANPIDSPLEKNLFIESNRTTQEKIVQGNYSFSLGESQSLRLGLERADTELESSLFIASSSGSEPPSPRFGGLSPIPGASNAGTTVQEIRYEGFGFHNWAINERMNLESSLVYETSEISQAGVVSKTRSFSFLRPALDYRFNLTDKFQIRASVRRNVSQLSFGNFAATANNDDREQNANAGNPELVPEKSWNYETELEYRLDQDAGVIRANFNYSEIEDRIGRINATTDPDNPISATGNIGESTRWGMFLNASSRLVYFDLPDAIISLRLGLFDSEIVDPFLGTTERDGGRGFGNLSFRQDVPQWGLSYGVEYRHPIHGGDREVDITTITEDFGDRSVDLFVSKVWFDDVTFRLDVDNSLDASRCRLRQRFEPSTVDGGLSLIEDSCSSRYRRLILSIQTTF